jgi:hypothetical protein
LFSIFFIKAGNNIAYNSTGKTLLKQQRGTTALSEQLKLKNKKRERRTRRRRKNDLS